jgi:hypothetical protein
MDMDVDAWTCTCMSRALDHDIVSLQVKLSDVFFTFFILKF